GTSVPAHVDGHGGDAPLGPELGNVRVPSAVVGVAVQEPYDELWRRRRQRHVEVEGWARRLASSQLSLVVACGHPFLRPQLYPNRTPERERAAYFVMVWQPVKTSISPPTLTAPHDVVQRMICVGVVLLS